MNNKAVAVYIFKLHSILNPSDAEKIRDTLKKQIEDGLVLHDPRTEYVKREISIDGSNIAVELVPLQARPYSLEELENFRAGAAALRGVVMIKDLINTNSQDVSAILDWDFRENELVAVWGIHTEPYRARDYLKTWIAYPYNNAGVGGE